MAAPSTCVITSPATSSVGAGPAGTYSVTVTGTTDASTPVELFDGVTSKGTATSSGAGAFTFSNKTLAVGAHSLTVRAGVDPDFTTSTAVVVTVVDPTADIGDPRNRKAGWYLNFLAGNTVYGIAENLLPPASQAACTWAGVSPLRYGLIGALNVKAGITDPTLYKPVEACLNLIAYNTADLNACRPWLHAQQALYKLATEAF